MWHFGVSLLPPSVETFPADTDSCPGSCRRLLHTAASRRLHTQWEGVCERAGGFLARGSRAKPFKMYGRRDRRKHTKRWVSVTVCRGNVHTLTSCVLTQPGSYNCYWWTRLMTTRSWSDLSDTWLWCHFIRNTRVTKWYFYFVYYGQSRCRDPLTSQKGPFHKIKTFISAARLLIERAFCLFLSFVAVFDKMCFQSRQNLKITARFFCLVSESLSFTANKTLNWSQTPFCWHCWHGDGQSLGCWGGSSEGVSVAGGRPPPPSSPGWAWGVGGRP